MLMGLVASRHTFFEHLTRLYRRKNEASKVFPFNGKLTVNILYMHRSSGGNLGHKITTPRNTGFDRIIIRINITIRFLFCKYNF